MQRNGTYSVVPRIPGGEITPEKLIVIGEIAQRLRPVHQDHRRAADRPVRCPGRAAARDLAAPGRCRLRVRPRLRQGGADRQVLRRLGLVPLRPAGLGALAIELELRYRGLRSPHKIKAGVSGCARECAEAQSKDIGVIATEKGWNLYVGGNGGIRPRHADLLATDLDRETLIRTSTAS